MKKNLHLTDPGQFMFERAVAQSAEIESQYATADNWARVIKEEHRQMLTAPQAAKLLSGKHPGEEPEDSVGRKVMALWRRKGIEVS